MRSVGARSRTRYAAASPTRPAPTTARSYPAAGARLTGAAGESLAETRQAESAEQVRLHLLRLRLDCGTRRAERLVDAGEHEVGEPFRVGRVDRIGRDLDREHLA